MPDLRYDGIAEWYDAEQARVAMRSDAPLERFAHLADPVGGLVVEVGCGTGRSAMALAARGWSVGGLDASGDQLELARGRAAWLVRGLAERLPFRDRSIPVVAMAFVHTDVDAFGAVLREVSRVLVPGGRVVQLGVHPCFVGPHADSPARSAERMLLVDGYAASQWVDSSPQYGGGIRHRVGARHVPLAELLHAFLDADLQLDRVVELGDGVVPWMLGLAAHATVDR